MPIPTQIPLFFKEAKKFRSFLGIRTDYVGHSYIRPEPSEMEQCLNVVFYGWLYSMYTQFFSFFFSLA